MDISEDIAFGISLTIAAGVIQNGTVILPVL